MSEGSKRYLKELGSRLPCNPGVRKRLLDQFEDYRGNAQDTHSNCTYEQMVTDFGPPEDMARELMRDVSVEEHRAFRNWNMVKRILALGMIVLFMILTIYIWFLKENPIYAYERIYDPTSTTSTEITAVEDMT